MELATAIGHSLDLVLRGDAPEPVCPTFFGASLTPLRKKCGGICPIAVSCTWRRLASQIVSENLGNTLLPTGLVSVSKAVQR